MTDVTISNKAESLFRKKMSKFFDKFATIETPSCLTNIQISRAKVNLVAAKGKGALTSQ